MLGGLWHPLVKLLLDPFVFPEVFCTRFHPWPKLQHLGAALIKELTEDALQNDAPPLLQIPAVSSYCSVFPGVIN